MGLNTYIREKGLLHKPPGAPGRLALLPPAEDWPEDSATRVAPGKDRSARSYWSALPWVVLAIGISTSVWLSAVIADAVESVARLRFERQTSDAKAVITNRIDFYSDILQALRALFASQGPVSRRQFHAFVESLDLKNRYPGFDLVNFATYVPAQDKERFEQAVRSDTSIDPRGYPHFRVKPDGERSEYFVLVYLEPMEGYEFAFGLDLGANPGVPDPGALAASQRAARDSGQLTASGQPIRVKSPREYVALAMRMPVYRADIPTATVAERRAAYLGSVGAGFNVDNLMNGVLDADTAKYMQFELYDVGSSADPDAGVARKERLLYDSERALGMPLNRGMNGGDARFSRALPIEVGGRVWEVRFNAPKNTIMGRVDIMLPWLVLLGGILSSALLAVVFYSLASSRSRAVDIANDMTKYLRESEASLAEAQHMARLGNWSFERSSGLMTWSSETCRILGVAPDGRRKPFADFLARTHPEDRARVEQALLGAIESRQHRDLEHRVSMPDGTIRWVHTIVQGDAAPPVPGTIMDITERKLAEQELLESRALLSDAQKLARVGCCQYSPVDGRVIWSEELYRIHGVDRESFTLSYASALALVHPDDRAAWEKSLISALRNGEPFTAEFRIVRPGGTVRHLRSLGEVIADSSGRPLRMLWSVLDITEHKHTEQALRSSAQQLTALSRRLVEVQEAERRQLSRELHDRVGQNLTALSINLDILRTAFPAGENVDQRARLNDSSELLESTVDSIENVMAELRPPMLDDYGLLPALHWYAKDFSKRTGVGVSVLGNDDPDRLAPEMEITLFRIAQEALTNVAKHAGASRVEIVLDHSERCCVMTLSDDGIGMEAAPERNAAQRPGLGMVTMRERAQAIGGRFSVRTVSGGGTQIEIVIP